MSSEKIDKKKKEVLFTLSDGTEIKGEVYLWLYSTNHIGAQRIDELLNDENHFIPVETVDGFVLLNSTNIMHAKTNLEEKSHNLIMMGEKYRVSITTLHHKNLEVDLFISLPEGFRRVKDYLNQPIRFFTFFQSGYILCINRDFILSIQD
ncbi:MAG: hypothetical protein KAQ97_07035 [Candidatus Fermentibacteraceae bacterium]|nr:hypothetical protein [Candidatus Fermentibacteraceae bacterium]